MNTHFALGKTLPDGDRSSSPTRRRLISSSRRPLLGIHRVRGVPTLRDGVLARRANCAGSWCDHGCCCWGRWRGALAVLALRRPRSALRQSANGPSNRRRRRTSRHYNSAQSALVPRHLGKSCNPRSVAVPRWGVRAGDWTTLLQVTALKADDDCVGNPMWRVIYQRGPKQLGGDVSGDVSDNRCAAGTSPWKRSPVPLRMVSGWISRVSSSVGSP